MNCLTGHKPDSGVRGRPPREGHCTRQLVDGAEEPLPAADVPLVRGMDSRGGGVGWPIIRRVGLRGIPPSFLVDFSFSLKLLCNLFVCCLFIRPLFVSATKAIKIHKQMSHFGD